jgi:hypothetical protein
MPSNRSPGRFHPGGGYDTDLATKKPSEVTRTQICTPCQAGDTVICRRIGRNPTLHLLQRGSAGGSRFALTAELHLAPRPFEEHDELCRNLHRDIAPADRNAIVRVHPRSDHFKEDILQAFYDGIKHKPETTFGNVKADVLADKDPTFRRANFCQVIRESAWPA